MFDANSITNVVWGDFIIPCPDYLPRSPVNPCATARCVRDNFLRRRRQERLRSPSNWRNNMVNTWVHRRDDNRQGPDPQYFLFKIPVASVSNCFVPVASVSIDILL